MNEDFSLALQQHFAVHDLHSEVQVSATTKKHENEGTQTGTNNEPCPLVAT